MNKRMNECTTQSSQGQVKKTPKCPSFSCGPNMFSSHFHPGTIPLRGSRAPHLATQARTKSSVSCKIRTISNGTVLWPSPVLQGTMVWGWQECLEKHFLPPPHPAEVFPWDCHCGRGNGSQEQLALTFQQQGQQPASVAEAPDFSRG